MLPDDTEATAARIAQLERELEFARHSVRELEQLLGATNDWLWTVDANAVYTEVSDRVFDFLGFAAEEVIGKTPFDLMSPDEAQRVAGLFGPIVAARAPFRGLINTNLHRDGRRVVLETSGIPLFDADGQFIGYRGVDRDITSTVEAQERALKLRDEIILAQSTPLIPLSDKVVVVPLIGALERGRLERVSERLLEGINERGARVVILDLTGTSALDSAASERLVSAAQAVRLLGARMILTGISPAVALMLVDHELELSMIEIKSTLQAGIEAALAVARSSRRARGTA